MTIEYQIKMVDDLIQENRESTIKDYSELLKDREAIEREVIENRIYKVNYSKIKLLDFGTDYGF